MHTRADQLSQLLVEHFDTLPTHCRHIEHMHEGVWFAKNISDKMAAMRTLTFFQACFNKKGLCLFYDGAYTGRSIPITAFDRTFRYFAYRMQTH